MENVGNVGARMGSRNHGIVGIVGARMGSRNHGNVKARTESRKHRNGDGDRMETKIETENMVHNINGDHNLFSSQVFS
jgi:hypothetical protein